MLGAPGGDEAERARVWRAIAADAPAYGFDPGAIFPGGPGDPAFALLRLEAWRIELAGAPAETPLQATAWRRV